MMTEIDEEAKEKSLILRGNPIDNNESFASGDSIKEIVDNVDY